MSNKVTRKAALEFALSTAEVKANEEVKAVLEKLVETVSKTHDSSKAKEKRSAEQAALEEQVLDALAGLDNPKTADVAKALGLSTQKVAPRLKAMVADGRVVETVTKGVKTFAVAVD